MKTITMKAILILIAFALNVSFVNAQFNKIHDLDSINGKTPSGGLLISDGTYLYGMTARGGTNNQGVIFKIKPDGTDFQKLLDFNGTNGSRPFGSLITDGTYFYGMTQLGGTNDRGVIFRIKPDGTDYNILHNLNPADGGQPLGTLLLENGYLFGMTSSYGTYGYGVIFKINTNGTGYAKLLEFDDTTNGKRPSGTLISDGTYLYGTTWGGSANGGGGVFKIMLDGTNFSSLYDFPNTSNHGTHAALLLEGSYLYGTTGKGGANDIGGIFKIKTDGTDFQFLLDHDSTANGIIFSSTLHFDGNYLYANGIQGGAYGNGNIFRMHLDGTGFQSVFDFPGNGMEGDNPCDEGLYDDGNYLFGMTNTGGANGFGTIFKLDKNMLPTSIENHENQPLVRIYPNPTHNMLTIETEKTMPVRIVNALGATVLRTQIEQGNNNIDLTSLTSGIYFIYSETSTFKLIKE